MDFLSKTMKHDFCYIVMVNYNNWEDTVECLETALKSEGVFFRIIVCDNNSRNESWGKMIHWAEGEVQVSCSAHKKIRDLVYPLLSKPVNYGIGEQDDTVVQNKLTFVRLKKNLGFAGGMNAGIKIALTDKNCKYIWCLNNDTVVDPKNMAGMIKALQHNKNCGICSSCTRFYDFPDEAPPVNKRVRINRWLGTNVSYIENKDTKNKLANYDGASFMVTREFIERVGLMEEQYFLYFEEPDWVLRGAKLGYHVVFYPEGIVYHKGGKSTNKTGVLHASAFADYCMLRSRILFTKKFYPYCLPTVYLGLLVSIFHRLERKQFKRIPQILKIMINPNKMIGK